MNSQPIGFIDSGVGGLTVAKEVMKLLPNERIYYLGDSKRNPYGPRSVEEVRHFARQLSYFLLEKNIKFLVIACNTASVAALETLQEELPIPVIGVIEYGTKAAVNQTKNKKIGMIGTQGTVQSKAYEKQIINNLSDAQVKSVACPKLVTIVEKNQFNGEIAENIVAEELASFKNTDIDTLVLGCTHYPLLQSTIQDYLGDKVTLVDPGVETAKFVKKYLEKHSLLNENVNSDQLNQFYTTGNVETFKKIASKWLETSQFEVMHVSTEEFIKDEK